MTLTITNTNETFEVKSELFDITTHYKYILVDKIHKLAKIAVLYSIYNAFYCSYNNTLAQVINENQNSAVINKLPNKLIQTVKEIIQLFRNIKIDITDNSKISVSFALVSKKVLQETNVFKIFIPFTNIRYIVKNVKYIEKMMKDITKLVYNKKYDTDIVWPITSYDTEIDEYHKKAYEITGLNPPLKK